MLDVKRHVVTPLWASAKETVKIFELLQERADKECPQALFVGGAVRNLILGEKVDDIDIATILPPEKVMDILGKADIRVIPTGIDHGTVTVISGEYSYEITTLRRDIETDGRRAVVAYTASWEEDAQRRDFTINTLLMDINGNIYDPIGCGLADLDARKVLFVGDAKQRITEDYLRILRFFRFSALYGAGKFDQEGLRACKDHADKIKSLSKERITQEFFKIISSDKPYEVLKIMFAHGVLTDFDFTGDDDLKFFEYFCNFQKKYRLSALSARLFVMADMNLDNVLKMRQLILFPKVFLKDISAINGALKLPDLSCDHAVRACIYKFGRNITAQTLMIELAQDRVMNSYAPKALDIIQNWQIPTFPITGNDLIAQGMKAGKALGEELERLENQWIDNDFKS